MTTLCIDNFSMLAPFTSASSSGFDPVIAGMFYQFSGVMNSQSHMRVDVVGPGAALCLKSTSGVNGNLSALCYPLPTTANKYAIGARYFDLLSNSAGTGGFGIVYTQGNYLYPLMLFTPTTTGLTVTYRNASNELVNQLIRLTSKPETYIDYVIEHNRAGAGNMTTVTVCQDNLPVFSEDVFNDVDQDLSVMVMGYMTNKEADEAPEGFITRHDMRIGRAVGGSANFRMTDFYINTEAKRLGMPSVRTLSVLGIEDPSPTIETNTGSSVLDVLSNTPNLDQWVKTPGTFTAKYPDRNNGYKTQYRLAAQSNTYNPEDIKLEVEGESKRITAYKTPNGHSWVTDKDGSVKVTVD